jgi:endonuclease/exonuclease/phosphatase family metal-dependent hydrolase
MKGCAVSTCRYSGWRVGPEVAEDEVAEDEVPGDEVLVKTIKVATYNLHSCVGTDGQRDPDRTLKVLRDIGPDIVAMQEVCGRNATDQYRFFEKGLGLHGVSAPLMRRRYRPFGNALFTRFPIVSCETLDLTVAPFEARDALICVLDCDGVKVRVVATHLGLFPHEQELQLKRLSRVIHDGDWPLTLVMGDFNIFGPARRRLGQLGAPIPLPRVRSFPSRRPLMSLDRIFSIPNGQVQSLGVLRNGRTIAASDHLPLIAELQIDPLEKVEKKVKRTLRQRLRMVPDQPAA